MQQKVNKWHLIMIAAVAVIVVVVMIPHGSKHAGTSGSSSTGGSSSLSGYTAAEQSYLTLVRSENSSDSDALSKAAGYLSRYPNLTDVEATDLGVNLGIIEATASDWSSKDPGPPSSRWDTFDRDYTYAQNALSTSASQMATGLDNTDPQTVQSANNLMNEANGYMTNALAEQPQPQ